MRKFDGCLICSDIDGTFRCDDETAFVNGEAVKYFTDNGGKFTFATGRSVHHLKTSGLCRYINAPACNLNGGVVYDYTNDLPIFERRIEFYVEDFIREMGRFLDEKAGIYIFNGCGENDTIKCNINSITEHMLNMKPVKLYFTFQTEESADDFKNIAIKSNFLQNCYICKSWDRGIEIDSDDATKGHGMDFIKEYLGNIHMAVGIGDYDNDVPLIKHADIGVAVGNATDAVKECADFIVKPCREFAIKDLIEILEKKVTK